MTDVVERLLAGTGGGKHWMDLHEEAAAEIVRLRARLEKADELADGVHKVEAALSKDMGAGYPLCASLQALEAAYRSTDT